MDEVRAATCVRIALPLCTHSVEEGALSPFAPPCSPTRRRTYTPLPACRTQLPVTPAQRPRSTGAHRVSKECGAHALCCHTPPRQGHTAVLTHRPDVCRRVRRYSGEVCELLRSTHWGRGDLCYHVKVFELSCDSLCTASFSLAPPLPRRRRPPRQQTGAEDSHRARARDATAATLGTRK